MQTGRMIARFVQKQKVSAARYRTSGSGVNVIGLIPDMSPRADGLLTVSFFVADTFSASGDLVMTAVHAGESMVSENPVWGGFGLFFIAPNLFYGKTASGDGTAGARYLCTVRATETASGDWAEIDAEIAVPDAGESQAIWAAQSYSLGAVTAASGDALLDVSSRIHVASVELDVAWVWAGDPTQMTGTPTFYVDSGLILRLHWPSMNYSGQSFTLQIAGRTAQGIHTTSLFVTLDLTATAISDPGIPPGWTLPPYPGTP